VKTKRISVKRHHTPGWPRRSLRRFRRYRKYIGPKHPLVTDYAHQVEDLGPFGFDRVSDGCKLPYGYRAFRMTRKSYRESTGLPQLGRAFGKAAKKGPKAAFRAWWTSKRTTSCD